MKRRYGKDNMAKLQIKVSDSEVCEQCGKRPCLEFYRRAEKGDNVNTVIYICRDCILRVMRKLLG